MKFYVTKRDIKLGRKGDVEQCPVAISLNRRVIGYCAAFEDVLDIKGTDYKTPKRVSTFIQMFDRGKRVKPFSFEIKEVSR